MSPPLLAPPALVVAKVMSLPLGEVRLIIAVMELMSAFAPLAAAPKLVRALEAVFAAVPPFAMATMPVTVPAVPALPVVLLVIFAGRSAAVIAE
jgi:hypothetical protein